VGLWCCVPAIIFVISFCIALNTVLFQRFGAVDCESENAPIRPAVELHCILLLLAYAIKTCNSSSSSRVELGQSRVQLRKRAGFDDVGHRLGLTTGAQISVCLSTLH